MSKLFPTLFSPAKIGNVTLKNRILKAPQSSGMNNKDGTVSERAIRYYSEQAAGGAGCIIVEYAYVDEIGAALRALVGYGVAIAALIALMAARVQRMDLRFEGRE